MGYDQEAHYHFTLCDVVDYVRQFGVDKVMIDVYDLLADECNTKVKQMEMPYEQ
jgi:methyl coenzyme M reductase subunit C-like uncharacterized protein (methanogenesis marker protein 7)